MTHHESGWNIDPNTPEFWITIGACVFLVLLGGLFAGLTIGLMSLDVTNLQIICDSGTPEQRKYAKRILPLRKKGHWLLSTLLIGNVIVNETLPILTESLYTGGWISVAVSSGLIVIFGEIIPQAVCSRYGLAIGSYFAWLVNILMYLFAFITFPIAKLLDWLLGEHVGYNYRRQELKALVGLLHHANSQYKLEDDEVNIIQSVLELRDKKVQDIMTPIENTFMISVDSKIDASCLKQIADGGHSRIPVYKGTDRENIIGMILVKSLISLHFQPQEEGVTANLRNMPGMIIGLPVISEQMPIFDVINLFQEGKSHMALVMDIGHSSDDAINKLKPYEQVSPITSPYDDRRASEVDEMHSTKGIRVLGIVTLEDAIEEIIAEEIVDETDQYIDTRSMQPVARTLQKFKKGLTPILGPMNPRAIAKYSREPSVIVEIPEKDVTENTPLLK